jgi:protein CMS1
MADDLDENFELDDEKFTPSNSSNINDDESIDEDEEKSQPLKKKTKIAFKETNSSAKIKKNKKKNITEILNLNRKEINKPNYATEEFKKILVKHLNEKLSSVEKNLLNLNEDNQDLDEAISNIIMKRNSKISHLPIEKQFDEKFNEKIQNYLKKPNSAITQSPYMIILCSSAMRCIELEKKISNLNSSIKSKQLIWMHAFAKHKKLNEQIKFIENFKKPIHLIYATPQRLKQLVDAQALRLDQLRYVLIDYTNRDCKQKRFIDMADLREEFIKFTVEDLLKLNKNGIKLKFYLA